MTEELIGELNPSIDTETDSDALKDFNQAKPKIKLLLFILIGGITFLLLISVVLYFIFAKKPENKDEKSGNNNPFQMKRLIHNLKTSSDDDSDGLYPISIDYTGTYNSEDSVGFEVTHTCFYDIKPMKGKCAFNPGSSFSSVTENTVLERNVNTKFGLAGSATFGSKVVGSLAGKLDYEDIVDQKNEMNYWSVFLLDKRKKVCLNEDEIKVTEKVEDYVKEIINDENLDKSTKVNKLYDGIASRCGFFVPLEIELGGRFEFISESKTETKKDEKAIAADLALKLLKIDKNNPQNATFSRDDKIIEQVSDSSIHINRIGGITVTSIEQLADWYNSLNESNYGFIGFGGERYLWEFFSPETKKIFKEYANEIEKKIDNFRAKYKLIQDFAKDGHPSDKVEKGDGDKIKTPISRGNCVDNYILKLNVPADGDGFWSKSYKVESDLPKPNCQKIVGYILKNCNKNDEQGGDYKFKDNILKSNYEFEFTQTCWIDFWHTCRNCWNTTICYVDLEDN